MGLSLRRHPLALIRHRLADFGVRTAEDLRTQARDRDRVLASGIVTHRQQPSTSKGVIFATLEDETGTVNIIVWPKLAEAQRSVLRQSRLLTVQGTWQSERGVNSRLRRSPQRSAGQCPSDPREMFSGQSDIDLAKHDRAGFIHELAAQSGARQFVVEHDKRFAAATYREPRIDGSEPRLPQWLWSVLRWVKRRFREPRAMNRCFEPVTAPSDD